MSVRKLVVTAIAAFAFVVAPSIVPIKPAATPVRVAFLSPCAPVSWMPVDTAHAQVPCGAPIAAAPTWPIIAGMLSVGSVILNAAIVSQTQCRELTQQEAVTSLLLPFVAIAMNQQKSKCKH